MARPQPMLEFETMSSTVRRLHYTIAQYVSLEEESSVRHEYLDGEIYALAGGSPDHAALAAVVIGLLRARLPRECRVFTSDLRIRIPATGLSTYPDVAVVCGRTQRAGDDVLAVVNPILLVEVTSDSTEDYDRGEKTRHFKQLSSVREILIVSHREPRLTLHRREGAEWLTKDVRAHETVELAGIGVHLLVDDVYEQGLEDLSPASA
jgi:Uma2 family endonuclease